MNGTFDPMYSSNNIWVDTNLDVCLTNNLESMVTDISSLQTSKVDKVDGKGLSSNDYTNTEKNKLAGIESGAQKNKVTGVKGNAESTYRTGNVNITPANIGAAASTHTHNKSQISGLIEPSDYVIASGASGQWTYRKWNSGISECWSKLLARLHILLRGMGSSYLKGVLIGHLACLFRALQLFIIATLVLDMLLPREVVYQQLQDSDGKPLEQMEILMLGM